MRICLIGSQKINNIANVENISAFHEIDGANILFVLPDDDFNKAIEAAGIAKDSNILTIGIAPKGVPVNFRKSVNSYTLTDNDEQSFEAVRAISSLLSSSGFVNLDFEDVNEFFTNAGKFRLSHSFATGNDRVDKAVNEILNGVDFSRVKNLLLNMTTGADISLQEMTQAANMIESAANGIFLKFGHVIDESLYSANDFLSMTLMAQV